MTSSASSIASTLKPELAEALSVLFSKLDSTAQGSISLDDLRRNWEQDQQNSGEEQFTKTITSNVHTGVCSLKHEKVLQSIEKFAVEGRLSYERLCCGIKLSLIEEMIEKDEDRKDMEEASKSSKNMKVHSQSTRGSKVGWEDREQKDEGSETEEKNTALPDWKKRFFSSSCSDENHQELQISPSSPSIAFVSVNGKQEQHKLNFYGDKTSSGGGDRKGDEPARMLQSHKKGPLSSSLAGERAKTNEETAENVANEVVASSGIGGLENKEMVPGGYKGLLYNHHKCSATNTQSPIEQPQNKEKKQNGTQEISGSASSAVEKSSSGYWSNFKSEEKSSRAPTLVSSINDEGATSSSSVWSSARLLSVLDSLETTPKNQIPVSTASSMQPSSRDHTTTSGKSLKLKQIEEEDNKSKHEKSWEEESLQTAHENIKFSSSTAAANGHTKYLKSTSLDVSTYSVNDKSLLTQSFMENFGYHPPREMSPVSVQLPKYNLPSTVCEGMSSDQLILEQQNTANSLAYNAEDLKIRTEETNFNSRWSSTPEKANFEHQNGHKLESERDLGVCKTGYLDENPAVGENASKSLMQYDGNDEDFLGRAQKEIKRFQTKLNLELPFERAASSNSSSTYTVKNSRSPIPPVSRNAYYELNDASDEDEKANNVSESGPSLNKSEASTRMLKSYETVELSVPQITLSSTPYKNVDPHSRLSLGLEEAKTENDCYKSRQKEKGARVNGTGEMNGYHHYYDSKYREDKSNSLCSKVYKVQSYEPSSFTNSTTAAANNQAEKMDKMLDQALRAVNESYRLIRIGKKNLRRRTDSLIGGNCISRSTHSSSTSLNNNTLNESSLDGSGVGSINSEKYLRLMNSVLELHKSLLDMIDTTNGEIPADLGDGEESCSQCGVCTTCQRNLQTFQLAVDQLEFRHGGTISSSTSFTS